MLTFDGAHLSANGRTVSLGRPGKEGAKQNSRKWVPCVGRQISSPATYEDLGSIAPPPPPPPPKTPAQLKVQLSAPLAEINPPPPQHTFQPLSPAQLFDIDSFHPPPPRKRWGNGGKGGGGRALKVPLTGPLISHQTIRR